MNIYIASDHAGFELKKSLVLHLENKGFNVSDMGPDSYDEFDDYPDFVLNVGKKVLEDSESFGIILGGTGQGEAIVVNRLKGVRAIVCNNENKDIPILGREHNNANIISLGARFLEDSVAKEMVDIFLETKFSEEERHLRRIKKIDNG